MTTPESKPVEVIHHSGFPKPPGPNPPQLNKSPKWWTQISAYTILSWILGAVLLVAAGLKGHQLLTGFFSGKTLLTSRAFQLLTVEVEIALGLWLVSGFYRKFARWTAMCYFLILAGTSAYLVAIAEECCGCLGRLAINPWFTFVFNLAAICALALCPLGKRAADNFSSRPWLATGMIASFCFLGIFLLVVVPDYPNASALEPGLGADGDLVVLDVKNWEGKRLPVLGHVDISPRLEKGNWVLIFYHSDCPSCEEAMRKEDETLREQDVSVALIEVPTLSGVPGGPPLKLGKAFVPGKLAPSRRWVVETPVVLRLENSIVTSVTAGSGGNRP